MAIAFDNQNGANGTATSMSVTHTAAGSDRYGFADLVGDVAADQFLGVSSGVVWGGVPMQLWAKVQVPGWRWLYRFFLAGPPSGPQTVTATPDASTYLELITTSYTGVAQVNPEAPAAGSRTYTGSSVTSLIASATTATDNAWLVQACAAQSGGILADTATTQRRTVLVCAAQDSGGAITPAGSASLKMKNGGSATNMGAIIAVIAPSAGGGGGGGGGGFDIPRHLLAQQAMARGAFY